MQRDRLFLQGVFGGRPIATKRVIFFEGLPPRGTGALADGASCAGSGGAWQTVLREVESGNVRRFTSRAMTRAGRRGKGVALRSSSADRCIRVDRSKLAN